MYDLMTEQNEGGRLVRTYRNAGTGTETKTTPIFKDKNGVQWWGFVDLFKIPYIRVAYSKTVADLFTMGLSLKDILEWCSEEKALLKSDDPEKYEKLYAKVLEKERMATFTADPVRQHLALCTIYVLEENERVDYFEDTVAEKKLKAWRGDMEATTFFLTWHTEHIQNYTSSLTQILPTVLMTTQAEKQLYGKR